MVIENGLFARIISTYLTWDHPPWRLFDEDLFVDDLVAGRANHCSTLLVNAILAYGCVSISVIAASAALKLTNLIAKLFGH